MMPGYELITGMDSFMTTSSKKPESLVRLGFRVKEGGTHNSRTMMFTELAILLDAAPQSTDGKAFQEMVIEQNILSKGTAGNRKKTLRHLVELYGLNPDIPLFRILRDYWDRSDQGKPVLAILCACARDSILRMTIKPLLSQQHGEEVDKAAIREALVADNPDRFSPASIKSIIQNTLGSWTTAGLLTGKVRKIRSQPKVTPINMAYALLLGYFSGARGQYLFQTEWSRILDLPTDQLYEMATQASRLGLINFKRIGNVMDVEFPHLTSYERELLHEPG